MSTPLPLTRVATCKTTFWQYKAPPVTVEDLLHEVPLTSVGQTSRAHVRSQHLLLKTTSVFQQLVLTLALRHQELCSEMVIFPERATDRLKRDTRVSVSDTF